MGAVEADLSAFAAAVVFGAPAGVVEPLRCDVGAVPVDGLITGVGPDRMTGTGDGTGCMPDAAGTVARAAPSTSARSPSIGSGDLFFISSVTANKRKRTIT